MKPVIAALMLATPAFADAPEILDVSVRGTQVSVTLRHADTGWDDYADGWRIENEAGDVLGTRVLAHPHVNEQPFTRSHLIADLPDAFYVRSKDLLTGWGSERVLVQGGKIVR